MLERTLVFIKPDGMQRGLAGEIIARLERPGLTMIDCKMILVSKEVAEEHYREHVDKDFFPHLINFITSAPILVMIFEGVKAVDNVRKIVGNTRPNLAAPGTIRGDLAHIDEEQGNKKDIGIPNLIHASDSKKAAKEEINRFFGKSKTYTYKRCDEKFVT